MVWHHIIAVALGGMSDPTNLRIACERHNQLAARRTFGDRWMDQFTRKGSADTLRRSREDAASHIERRESDSEARR